MIYQYAIILFLYVFAFAAYRKYKVYLPENHAVFIWPVNAVVLFFLVVFVGLPTKVESTTATGKIKFSSEISKPLDRVKVDENIDLSKELESIKQQSKEIEDEINN